MKRVLLIDDEPTILLMLKKMIERAGDYEVDLAQNGLEGMKLINDRQFDLVVTDIIMPEKEGLEIIAELRRTKPDIKVIAISGGGRLSPEGYLESANMLGADKTFKKPFEQKELVGAINELLS